MALTCWKCKRQISDEDAIYCPFCSSSLNAGAIKRTDFPIVGGALMIVTAAICVMTGIEALVIFLSTFGIPYNHGFEVEGFPFRLEDLLAGMLGIATFVYGLAAGILALKRRHYGHCIGGGLLTSFEGVLVGLAFAYQWPNSWILSAIFGIPIIILSTTATLFISLSEKEFQ